MSRTGESLLDLSRKWSAESLFGSRRAALAAALLLFGAASLAGVWSLPEIPGGARWGLLFVVGATLVPVGTALNAAEFALSATLLGRRIDAKGAFRTALVAGAFNLLPLPGAAAVRTQALYGLGATYGKAIGSTLVVSMGALGTALAFTGLVLAGSGWAAGPGAALLAGGLALLAGVYAAARREMGGKAPAARLTAALVAVEAASIAVKALRIYLVVVALRQPVTWAQAAVIALVWVLTLFVGFFPGGLGIREVLAAAVSPLVAVHPSVGVTTSAIDRILGLVFLWLLTLLVLGGVPKPPPESR